MDDCTKVRWYWIHVYQSIKEDNVPLTIRYGTILSTGSMGIAKLTPDDIPEPTCRKQKSFSNSTIVGVYNINTKEAKRPWRVKVAVFMPMMCPNESSKGPPELPRKTNDSRILNQNPLLFTQQNADATFEYVAALFL